MVTVPVTNQRALVKSLLIIPVLLLLIAPLISSREPVMQIFYVKYFWLTGMAVLLVPLVIATVQRSSLTRTDLLVMLFTAYVYSRSLLSTVPAMESRKATYFLIAALAYFAIKQVLPAGKRNAQLWLLATVFITAIITCVYGILQKTWLILPFNSNFPVTGTFYQPAAFAGFIAGIFPVACYTCFRYWKHDNSDRLIAVVKIMAAVTASLIIFILPSVQSRAAIVGLIAGVVFMAATMEEGKLFLRRLLGKGRSWKLFLFAVALLVVVVAGYRLRTSSANGRLLVWKISGQMVLYKPLFGFGTDAFRSVYPDYQIAYFKSGMRPENEQLLSCEVTEPFNEIIHICCEWGLVGLLLFVLIIISVFKNNNVKADNSTAATPLQTGAKAALVSWLVFGQFAYPFSIPELTLYFFVFLALADGSLKAALFNLNTIVLGRIRLFFIVLVCGVFIIQLVPTYKTWQGVKLWNEANRATSAGLTNHAFNEAFPLLKNNDIFLAEYAFNSFRQGRYNESLQAIQLRKSKYYNDLLHAGDIYEQLSRPDSAKASYKEAFFLLPHRFTPLYKLMRLYENSGDLATAAAIAREILTKPVKIESAEVNRIKQEAGRLLKKANSLF